MHAVTQLSTLAQYSLSWFLNVYFVINVAMEFEPLWPIFEFKIQDPEFIYKFNLFDTYKTVLLSKFNTNMLMHLAELKTSIY